MTELFLLHNNLQVDNRIFVNNMDLDYNVSIR